MAYFPIAACVPGSGLKHKDPVTHLDPPQHSYFISILQMRTLRPGDTSLAPDPRVAGDKAEVEPRWSWLHVQVSDSRTLLLLIAMGLSCTQQAHCVQNHVDDDNWHLSSIFSDLRTINLRINRLNSAHSEHNL